MPLLGEIIDWAGADENYVKRHGYVLCYGQAISRTTFVELFTLITTTYGTGDGSTTFNVPDLRDRSGLGKGDMGGTDIDVITAEDTTTLGRQAGQAADAHTLTEAEMPAHGHDTNTFGGSGIRGTTTLDAATRGTFASTISSQEAIVSEDTGSDTAHSHDVLHPCMILNKAIYTNVRLSV